MRNQTSFRLTTTLLPTDTTAKTTTVINKVDSNGDKFYPTFTEETVVITNDDRTVMETTRAVCTDWALTFVKRGLSDDNSETPVDNRKLTWNPWSLCFITAWAWDWIDKDDNITWTGNQTYTGNLVSQWNATYNWLLTTNKWVKYPNFANVEALNAYANPFGWMFATVDSTGELYRYNAVTEQRDVITTNTPTNPEMADDETIWTVRVATDAEFEAWTEQWSSNEYLMPTVTQVKWMWTKVVDIIWTDDITWAQAVLDAVLWWEYVVVRYKSSASSLATAFFYLESYSSAIIRLYRTRFTIGTWTPSWTIHWTSTWYFIDSIWLIITYSWTTVTDLRDANPDSAFVPWYVEKP